jgi:hypothetical protein
MTQSQGLILAAAIVLAAVLAWWPWRGTLDPTLAKVAAVARGVAILALLLLLLDPGIRATVRRSRPLVLLDNSVSMHATGGHADSAATLAASLGEVLHFGEAAPNEPGGRTNLVEPLTAAISAGRPLIIVTDGEVADVGALPTDLLAQATVQLLPRRGGADVALTDVRLPARLAAGDTLHVAIDLQASGGFTDSVRIEVRDGARVLTSGTARFGVGNTSASLQLSTPLPADLTGERWLDVVRIGAPDAEPLDDRRLRKLIVTPSPGIVVVAATPDWDARTLYTTLDAVTTSPVRGYVQLQRGVWHRMDDLRAVAAQEVTAAARAADLVAVRGDTTPWRQMGRARLLWPVSDGDGDWYLTPAGLSPLGDAFVGLDADSLPSLPAASPVPTGDWVALTAQQARRGAEVPVVSGREAGGRTVIIGAAGFHAWSFQGGAAEQAWRTMIGQASAWLLAAPASDGALIRTVEPVTQRGRPLRFRAANAATPVEVTFATDSVVRIDTLRFDGDGLAEIVLPPGRFTWRTSGNGSGTVAVEDYSDELVPTAASLTAREAVTDPVPARRSLREMLPLFLLAVVGFGTEWGIRRKLGLR